MDMSLVTAVSGVLSGGLLGSLATVYTARQKAPAERDSITVTGAETAVRSLERSLAAETVRADRAEAAVLVRDQRIEAMQVRLDGLQSALDEVRAELHAIISSEV